MTRPIHYERLIIGYHGCDRKVGERVLLHGDTLQPSANNYDWLGRGIYFWEHGPARALEWAEGNRKRKKNFDPFVLGAFIHLGRCFDLTDTAATGHLKAWFDDLKVMLEQAGQPMPVNGSTHPGDGDLRLRFLDCAVLNFGLNTYDIKAQGTHYQTVRGVFPEGDPAFPGSRIMMKTHVQVAVRDAGCIVGFFRPIL